ncbi:unnamed protein product, partial [Ectocarpus sp. 13 AM-2016]
QDTPPGPNAATIDKGTATTGTDHPKLLTELVTPHADTHPTSATTTPNRVPSLSGQSQLSTHERTRPPSAGHDDTEPDNLDTPPGPKAATIEYGAATTGAGRPNFLMEPATPRADTQTSGSTTIPDGVPSRKEQSQATAEEPTRFPSDGDDDIEPDLPDTPSGAKATTIDNGAATPGTDHRDLLMEPKARHAATVTSGSSTTPD